MNQLVSAVAKGIGLLLVGALSGVLAVSTRRRGASKEHLVVTTWTKQPGDSPVITQTLVRKIDGRWVNDDDGVTVHELRLSEEARLRRE